MVRDRSQPPPHQYYGDGSVNLSRLLILILNKLTVVAHLKKHGDIQYFLIQLAFVWAEFHMGEIFQVCSSRPTQQAEQSSYNTVVPSTSVFNETHYQWGTLMINLTATSKHKFSILCVTGSTSHGMEKWCFA